MAAVRLEAIAKTYPNGHTAIHGVDIDIGEGEFLVLVGPSGCGKSTLLRLMAGLETPTSGRIFIGGADVTLVPPQARDLAMVLSMWSSRVVTTTCSIFVSIRATPARSWLWSRGWLHRRSVPRCAWRFDQTGGTSSTGELAHG